MSLFAPIIIILVLCLICLWGYCVINILNSNFNGNEKLLWVVVVLLAPVLGMLLYLILGKRSKIRRRFNPYQK